MKELVNTCYVCGKDLYCIDGFFNGVHTDDKKTLCYNCIEEQEKSAD